MVHLLYCDDKEKVLEKILDVQLMSLHLKNGIILRTKIMI